MDNDILKVSISKEELDNMVKNIGNQINNDYKGKNPLIIGILKGAVPFMNDLLKVITLKVTTDYLRVSSYQGTKSTGTITIKGDIPDVKDKDVIIVEDIIDTGRTLKELKKLFEENGAKSIKIATLLDKPEGRKVEIEADYVGGIVPNEFVVGYGLDYNEYYRNLPYIGVLKEEVYKK